MPEEIWKDIPGYEGRYQVSNLGRVRSLGFWLEHGCRGGRTVRQYYPPHFCEGDEDKFGHRRVSLSKPGAPRKRCLVHKLVMLVFVGECPEGKEVCHNDGDPRNNRLENLRYDTRSENQRDKFRMNRYPRQKLTEEDVAEIRKHIADGVPLKDIARKYNVGHRQICYIKNNQQWYWSHKEVS